MIYAFLSTLNLSISIHNEDRNKTVILLSELVYTLLPMFALSLVLNLQRPFVGWLLYGCIVKTVYRTQLEQLFIVSVSNRSV